MIFFLKRRTIARLFFDTGIIFMLLGCAFLIGSKEDTSQIYMLVSFLFLILGVCCAIIAIRIKKSSLYLFFACFSLLVGIFLFLSGLDIIPITFSRSWPLLSVFTGIALFPAGWYFYGRIRIRYIVPSLAFIILGSILLIFSLKLVSFSLAQFVKDWWPLLLLIWGLIFLLVSLGTKNTGNTKIDT
jgi:hypothetical protein